MPKRHSHAESVPPNPADLIESIRGFGYTLQSALADLIDNSLAAGATWVQVTVDPGPGSPHIAVVDNGRGMPCERLVEAMRMGTFGPLASRGPTDLGRFGLGMKTASLSQGRSLTVATKENGRRSPAIRRWDLAHVREVADWQLLDEPTAVAQSFADQVEAFPHGTAVVIENLDRASFLELSGPQLAVHLAAALETVRRHLGMVFHRFIAEDGLQIRLGESQIPAWDPYLVEVSTRLPQETLHYRGQLIDVVPFVLPHHSRLTDDQHSRAGGPFGWNKHQGFYIYRCRRLIVPGDWLNLNLRQEEHYKLARIRLDLPNTMDSDWHLNVMKSHVAAPAALRDEFRRIAADVRRQASEVYRVRGEREAPEQHVPQHPIWRRESTRTGVRYRVDRSHPVMRALLHAGCGHDKILADVLSVIEGTVPVAAMMQEPQKAIDGSVRAEPPADMGSLVDMVLHAEQFYVRTGKSLGEARTLVLSCEPFVRFREPILAVLNQRTGTRAPKD